MQILPGGCSANQAGRSEQWAMCAAECCGRSGGGQQTTSDQRGRRVSKGHKSKGLEGWEIGRGDSVRRGCGGGGQKALLKLQTDLQMPRNL